METRIVGDLDLQCRDSVAATAAETRAAAFQNLGFESAVINPPLIDGWLVPASQALPNWTSDNWYNYQAGYETVGYDTIAISSRCISVHDGTSGNVGDFNPLQGKYSVMLQDGTYIVGDPVNTWDAIISQVGDVPSYARSLMLKTDTPAYLNDLVVSLNGTVIPMQVYSVGGDDQ